MKTASNSSSQIKPHQPTPTSNWTGQGQSNVDVAVIILTFNEEQNLPAALDSVKGWAKEVFVVDSYSTDRTIDIALSRATDGVSVVQHTFENYSAQWNWALTHLPIKSTWTLKLDADERVTPSFKVEVTESLRDAPQDLDGLYFRRRMVFMGKPLHRGGFSSTFVLHLWRTGKAVFEERPVNEHALIQGQTKTIKAYVDHCNSKSISDWIDKHNRYSSMEAQSIIAGDVTGDISPRFSGTPDERRMWLRGIYRSLPFRQIFYFLYRYVFQLGFLDGKVGFRYCFLHTVYRYWIDLKINENERTNKSPEVIWPPRGQLHPTVAASEIQAMVNRSE